MRHHVKMVDKNFDASSAPEGSVMLRTIEDGKKILTFTAKEICGGTKPPEDFRNLTALMSRAVASCTVQLMQGTAQIAAEGGCTREVAAASMANSVSLLCDAAAEILTDSIERLVADTARHEFSTN